MWYKREDLPDRSPFIGNRTERPVKLKIEFGITQYSDIQRTS
jgi:hypothetical protein